MARSERQGLRWGAVFEMIDLHHVDGDEIMMEIYVPRTVAVHRVRRLKQLARGRVE